MSVKVTKTQLLEDWVQETTKNIKETIETGEILMDLNLLPREIKEMIINQVTGGKYLTPFIQSNLNVFGIKKQEIFWPHGVPKEIKEYLEKLIDWLSSVSIKSEGNPFRIPLSSGDVWAFNGYIYKVEYKNQIKYSYAEEELLVLETYDQERQKFEKLKRKHKTDISEKDDYPRERIPESVRISVWRRDSGKCARCGSREKLEYDHIVPVSKGGGNTARNIELLCESCNRKKSNNIA